MDFFGLGGFSPRGGFGPIHSEMVMEIEDVVAKNPQNFFDRLKAFTEGKMRAISDLVNQNKLIRWKTTVSLEKKIEGKEPEDFQTSLAIFLVSSESKEDWQNRILPLLEAHVESFASARLEKFTKSPQGTRKAMAVFKRQLESWKETVYKRFKVDAISPDYLCDSFETFVDKLESDAAGAKVLSRKPELFSRVKTAQSGINSADNGRREIHQPSWKDEHRISWDQLDPVWRQLIEEGDLSLAKQEESLQRIKREVPGKKKTVILGKRLERESEELNGQLDSGQTDIGELPLKRQKFDPISNSWDEWETQKSNGEPPRRILIVV